MEIEPIRQARLLNDLSGRRFGLLTAIRPVGAKRFRGAVQVVYACRCDCGADVERDKQSLLHSKTPSCGCDRRGLGTSDPGSWSHPLRKTWRHMLSRCYDAVNKSFPDYGGRGIKVCDRWICGEDGATGFACFVADMGDRPPGGMLERDDNEQGYSPANCRWANRTAQNRNKRSNRLITAFGRTAPVSVWAAETGIPYFTLMQRVKRGWDHERAVTPT